MSGVVSRPALTLGHLRDGIGRFSQIPSEEGRESYPNAGGKVHRPPHSERFHIMSSTEDDWSRPGS
jgi:hypothetical protein